MEDWSTSKMLPMVGKMAWHVPTLTCLIKIVRHPIQWRKFLRGKWGTKRCDNWCLSIYYTFNVRCQGEKSCKIPGQFNYVFGDPCKGTNKYLKVVYECTHGWFPKSKEEKDKSVKSHYYILKWKSTLWSSTVMEIELRDVSCHYYLLHPFPCHLPMSSDCTLARVLIDKFT